MNRLRMIETENIEIHRALYEKVFKAGYQNEKEYFEVLKRNTNDYIRDFRGMDGRPLEHVTVEDVMLIILKTLPIVRLNRNINIQYDDHLYFYTPRFGWSEDTFILKESLTAIKVIFNQEFYDELYDTILYSRRTPMLVAERSDEYEELDLVDYERMNPKPIDHLKFGHDLMKIDYTEFI